MISSGLCGGEIKSRKKQLVPFAMRVKSKEARETEAHPINMAPLHFAINQSKLKSIIFYCCLSVMRGCSNLPC